MEIIVQGKGEKFVSPEEVVMTISFTTKGYSYEEVLNNGTKNVKLFVDNILIPNGFSKEDMKTRNFVIREETKYNNITNSHEPDGYSYNQYAVLKYDYDIEKMAKMMEEISRLENPPKCQVNFSVKDEKACRRSILAVAYKDAEEQAKAIANSAGKILKECVKVDFKPFTTEYVSETALNSDIMFDKALRTGAAPMLVNTFTPEDIQLQETLYCLWIAE